MRYYHAFLAWWQGFLTGCTHRDTTFPQSHRFGTKMVEINRLTGAHVNCKDCGREFAYDWKEMRIVYDTDPRWSRVRKLSSSGSIQNSSL